MISPEQKKRLKEMWESWDEVEKTLKENGSDDQLYDGFQGLEGPMNEKGEFDARIGVQGVR